MVLVNLIDEYIKFYIFKLYIFISTLLHLFQKSVVLRIAWNRWRDIQTLSGFCPHPPCYTHINDHHVFWGFKSLACFFVEIMNLMNAAEV